MSKDNVGARHLSARQVTVGHSDSLVNTYGRTLPDGAQCWVVEEQANYRFLKSSELHADGTFVVMPVDGQGRWVREQGLVGFALLIGGKLAEAKPEQLEVRPFLGYQKSMLVQFAEMPDGRIIYTGRTPRMAYVMGSAAGGGRSIGITRRTAAGESLGVASGMIAASTTLLLGSGDTLQLHTDDLTSEQALGQISITLL